MNCINLVYRQLIKKRKEDKSIIANVLCRNGYISISKNQRHCRRRIKGKLRCWGGTKTPSIVQYGRVQSQWARKSKDMFVFKVCVLKQGNKFFLFISYQQYFSRFIVKRAFTSQVLNLLLIIFDIFTYFSMFSNFLCP